MEILSKEELSLLFQIGTAAVLKNDIVNAAAIFRRLKEYDPDSVAPMIGNALICIVKDAFEDGESMLDEVLSREELDCRDDVLALKCLSAALQDDRSRFEEIRSGISAEAESAQALVTVAESMLSF